MTDRLTAAGFREWLEVQPRRVPVGVQGREDQCPLARYLGDGWLVYPDRAYPHFTVPSSAPGVLIPPGQTLPASWASRFVRAVDALPWISYRERRVYPRVALELLDEALGAEGRE